MTNERQLTPRQALSAIDWCLEEANSYDGCVWSDDPLENAQRIVSYFADLSPDARKEKLKQAREFALLPEHE